MLLATPSDHLGVLTCFNSRLRALTTQIQRINTCKEDLASTDTRKLAKSYVLKSVSHLGLLSSMGAINSRKLHQFTLDEALKMEDIMNSLWMTEESLHKAVEEVKVNLDLYRDYKSGLTQYRILE